MDSKQFREAAVSSIDEIVKYYDTIEQRRVVSNVEPGYLRKLLPDHAPEEGEPWPDIQKDIESKIVPGLTHWQSPNFLAWFPSSSSFPAMLGEMYSTAFTGAAFNWICSPAVTELETIVMDWLARAFALPGCYLSTGPTRGGGVIHGTASEAIATVMVAARDKYLREATAHLAGPGQEEEREDAMALRRGRLVALASATTHSATKKAAMITGVRFRAVPVYAADDYRLTGAGLRKAIEELRAKGLEPFYLTVTLGTTDTCSTDDFDSIADVLAELGLSREDPAAAATATASSNGTASNGTATTDAAAAAATTTGNGSDSDSGSGPGEVWVHVDAAYAGSALVCPEHQGPAAGFARFHSFNANLHKWLLTNFDCSALWVRRRAWLVDALAVTLAIARNDYSDSGLVTDYRDWQIPFGRRFRSLKVWFVLRAYGLEGLRAHVRRGVALGEAFAARVRERADLFELVAGPRYALTVFRLRGKGRAAGGGAVEEATLEEQNAVTKTLCDLLNAEGKIFLSSTVVGGVFAMRHCPATPFVEEDHVQKHFEIIVEAAERVLAQP